MSRYKLFKIFLFFLVLSVMLGACSGTSKNIVPKTAGAVNTTENPKVTLRFISSWGGVDSKAETLKSVLNQFEKENPDIRVVNESLFGEDFLPKIKTDFASGNDPDVFGFWPGSDINALVKAGKVADLTKLLNQDSAWKNSFSNDMWNYTTYNGRIYGLPVEVIFECMFVNKDLFERYNIGIPKDFDSLKQAVVKFRQVGITPIAFNSYAEGTYLYQSLSAIIGGKEDTEKPFNGDRVKESQITAMKYIKELYDLNAFPYDYLSLTNNERNTLFIQKKAAMIVQGSWFIGNFGANDDSIDIIPFPYVKGYKGPEGTMVYGLGGGSFHMSASVEDNLQVYKASIRLLKDLTSPKTAAVFAKETGMISNVNIDRYDIKYRSLTVKGMNMLKNAKLLVGPLDSFVERTSWESDISNNFPYFLDGEMSAQEVWEKAIENGIIPD